jgi:DNA-binding NarL/FixJ family response regulator
MSFRLPPMTRSRIQGDAAGVALRVLVVDDSERFLDAARGLLERQGVIVVGVARSGVEAIREARRLSPDVSLVDIDLGGESGFDVARRLDEIEGAPSKVIIISTHAEEDFADLIAGSPALGFLSKSRLSAETIRGMLDRTGPEQDGRTT